MIRPEKTRPWRTRRRLHPPEHYDQAPAERPDPVDTPVYCAECAKPIVYGGVLVRNGYTIHADCETAWSRRACWPLI